MSIANFTNGSLPTFFETNTYSSYYTPGAGLLLVLAVYYYNLQKRDIAVPAVGPSGRLTSYYGAVKFFFNARAMLEEGYSKYKGATFKAPRMGSWHVVISKPELIEEVRKVPDDKLSIAAAFDESLQLKYTLGPYVYADRFHEGVIRSKLTPNIAGLFDDIKDEIFQAFSDNIVIEGSDWEAIPALKVMTQVVCRTSNRVFVGLPLCRNKDYIGLNIRFTREVAEGTRIINLFPEALRGIAGIFFTSIPRSTRLGVKLLGPVIEARLKQYEIHGKVWPGKPNDLLSWLIDEAYGEHRSVLALTQRMLTVNFVAIHTSSMSFTQALYELASRPEYVQPLREEIERVIESEGWSKVAMQKMRKLDSFMRESQRHNGIGLTSLGRKALVDYRLSDGTFLPKGTFIEANQAAIHRHDPRYSNPELFDGFRFSNIREEVEGESAKNQFVATSNEYLPFGHGRHACPGRFFAANELKCMMVYLLLNYDVKLEGGVTTRPKNFDFGTIIIPDPKGKIMLRKRQL